MDGTGKIGGLLDIAKCLYDAVHRIQKQALKKQEEEGDGEDDSTLVLGAVMKAAKAMNTKGKASAKNQKALQVTVHSCCSKSCCCVREAACPLPDACLVVSVLGSRIRFLTRLYICCRRNYILTTL